MMILLVLSLSNDLVHNDCETKRMDSNVLIALEDRQSDKRRGYRDG